MGRPLEDFWRVRLERLQKRLEANRFEVFIAEGPDEAKEILLRNILPTTGAVTVAREGSRTFQETRSPQSLREHPGLEFLDPFAKGLSPEQSLDCGKLPFPRISSSPGPMPLPKMGNS